MSAVKEIATSNVKGDSLPWVPFTPYSDEVFLKYFKIDPVHGEIVSVDAVPARLCSSRPTTTPGR